LGAGKKTSVLGVGEINTVTVCVAVTTEAVKVGQGVSVFWSVDVAEGCSIASIVGVSDGDSVVLKVSVGESVSVAVVVGESVLVKDVLVKEGISVTATDTH